MSNPVIEVKNVSKKFRIGENQPYYSLRDSIADLFKNPLQKHNTSDQEFWALKNVSFELEQGQALGILGANGAGKSTLLKILSQITPPTSGEITLRGRVSSLLEVGTGFHPELTGRENIFLNGAILGMKQKEIKQKFDEIVAFAEIEKFLDMPVKRYSSGMYTRLAFAVAANLESEILLLDEVLAVGDAQFQKKCLGKMKEVQGSGRTIILISHSPANIQAIANVGLFIDHGKTEGVISVQKAIKQYLNKADFNKATFHPRILPKNSEAYILQARILNNSGETSTRFKVSEPITIEITWKNNAGVRVTPNIALTNDLGMVVALSMDAPNDWDGSKKKQKGKYISKVTIPPNILNMHDYYIQISLDCSSPIMTYHRVPNALRLTVWDPMDKNSIARGAYSLPITEPAIWPAWDWQTEFKKTR